MRVAYLGPPGTFNDDALRAAAGGADLEPVATGTVRDAILAVESGEVERALVPYENSIEGSVRTTLDTLVLEAESVTIVGEHDHPIRHGFIARRELPLQEVRVVLSHPQALAQCARFIREELWDVEERSAPSTADAVRQVAGSDEPWAAIAASSAARMYGCEVLADGIEDDPGNVTRFVWIAAQGSSAGEAQDGEWRTTLVFSELGADRPGALVEALLEFSDRGVNLTRIESRPLRMELGRYMFFLDVEGPATDATVAEAIAGLRSKAESVRLLGSYPVRASGIP
jgi:prephenate dehydratase